MYTRERDTPDMTAVGNDNIHCWTVRLATFDVEYKIITDPKAEPRMKK